jgi:hypothetical protein
VSKFALETGLGGVVTDLMGHENNYSSTTLGFITAELSDGERQFLLRQDTARVAHWVMSSWGEKGLVAVEFSSMPRVVEALAQEPGRFGKGAYRNIVQTACRIAECKPWSSIVLFDGQTFRRK